MESIYNSIQLATKLRPLNIFINETFDLALSQAHNYLHSFDSASRHERPNLLPIAVKDCFAVAGAFNTCGSKMLHNYQAPYTATVVKNLCKAGGVVIGKTNLDEFCMGSSSTASYFGPVINPWTMKYWKKNEKAQELSDWLIAGGSSGGSAAAVASGIVSVAFGSDTGGSTRNPAAHCGVVGVKPSYGLLSRHGLIPLTHSLDVPGVLAADVGTAATVLALISGYDLLDSTSLSKDEHSVDWLLPSNPSVAGLTIGVPDEYCVATTQTDILTSWDCVLGLLNDSGAIIKRVSLPHTPYSIQCYHVIGECEVASNMARYDGMRYGYRATDGSTVDTMYAASRHDAFNEVVRRRILAGNYFLLRENIDRYLGQAMRVRRLIAQDFSKVFNDGIDIILTPTTSSTAMPWSQFKSNSDEYERERQDDYFTQPANMAGLPAMSLPVAVSPVSGLPIGLQLIANKLRDSLMLTVAKWLETRLNFSKLDTDLLVKWVQELNLDNAK